MNESNSSVGTSQTITPAIEIGAAAGDDSLHRVGRCARCALITASVLMAIAWWLNYRGPWHAMASGALLMAAYWNLTLKWNGSASTDALSGGRQAHE